MELMELPAATEPSCSQSRASENQPTQTWDVLAFPARLLAEQITWMDAELFKQVVPQHCLGAIWCQRKKNGNKHVAPTVQAMVTQFNNVAVSVITTCLGDLTSTPQDRAKRVEFWIQVAKECKKLSNFSSMHAIVCALQSTSVFRLKKTWDEVSRKSSQKFKELCKKDAEVSRRLLQKENYSKIASLLRKPQKSLKKWQKKGVVPFLGSILTDLSILDATMLDDLEGNEVNQQKRMKENQILKEIMLLQTASEKYNLEPIESFCTGFKDMKRLNVTESYALSCQLEPV